jgi:hypothetical protein
MQKHRFATNVMAGAAITLAFTGTAQANGSRSFVATYATDNPACSAASPCRDLAAALAVTNSGGEIVVLNSGGYGPATITQPVVITAIGVDASITAASGNGLTINTSGNVTITGLNLDGVGTGNDGILVSSVGFLRLYSMQIQNFANDGIEFGASGGNLALYDSKINDCASYGLEQDGGQAYVRNTEFNHNLGGAASLGGQMAIADSSALYNYYGFLAAVGTIALHNDRAIFNMIGMAATSGVLSFADCLLSNNATSWFVGTGGTIAGSSPGTTLITPGQATGGMLSPATALQ